MDICLSILYVSDERQTEVPLMLFFNYSTPYRNRTGTRRLSRVERPFLRRHVQNSEKTIINSIRKHD